MRKTRLIYAAALALGSLIPSTGLEAYAQDEASKEEARYSVSSDSVFSAGKSSGLEKKTDSSDGKLEKKKCPVYEFVPGKTRADDVVRIYVRGNVDEERKAVEETKGMKGISYDSKRGYFLVTPVAKKDGTYDTFRDVALLEKINADGMITQDEIDYVTKYSPKMFEGVFTGKESKGPEADKKDKVGSKKKEPVRYEDLGWVERLIIDSWSEYHRAEWEKVFGPGVNKWFDLRSKNGSESKKDKK